MNNYMYGKEVADKISQDDQESGMPEVLYCCPKKQGYKGHRVEHSSPDDMPYIRVDIHIKLQAENERFKQDIGKLFLERESLRSALEDIDALRNDYEYKLSREDCRIRARQALKGNTDE